MFNAGILYRWTWKRWEPIPVVPPMPPGNLTRGAKVVVHQPQHPDVFIPSVSLNTKAYPAQIQSKCARLGDIGVTDPNKNPFLGVAPAKSTI